MNRHSIDVSIVSLANPWLDFLDAPQAVTSAHECNADLEQYCADATQLFSSESKTSELEAGRRMKAFGIMPLAKVSTQRRCEESGDDQASPSLCGAILGSRGLGKGLDDPALEPVWEKAAELGLVLFLHPHYGVVRTLSAKRLVGVAGQRSCVAARIGFPFETAAATTRLILAGVFDRHPNLKLLVAHSEAL